MSHHYHPRVTEAGLAKVLRSMSAEETVALYRRAATTGTSIREVVGRTAYRADMWQFVELVSSGDTGTDSE